MFSTYEDKGISFRYPQNWELQEQPAPSGVMVSVDSPGTAFWSVSLEYDGPDPSHVIEEALSVFRSDYPELDSYPVETKVCHCDCVGQDLEFVCLDLLNTACLRAFRTGEFTVLVLYQACDDEMEDVRSALEAITASLQCEGDELLFDE